MPDSASFNTITAADHANVDTRAGLYLVLACNVSAVTQKLVQGVRLNLLHVVLALLNEPLDG